MKTLLLFPLVLLFSACAVIPTSNGNAVVFGSKAEGIAVADANTGHVVFEAFGLDQTESIRYVRDGYIADRLFNFLRAESANDASTAIAGTEAGVAKHEATEQTRRVTEREITRRALID